MATITYKTGDDVDAALAFLGRQLNPQISGEQYLLDRLDEVKNKVLKEADDKRFNLVQALMNDKEKGASISKLRELLGV